MAQQAPPGTSQDDLRHFRHCPQSLKSVSLFKETLLAVPGLPKMPLEYAVEDPGCSSENLRELYSEVRGCQGCTRQGPAIAIEAVANLGPRFGAASS